MVLSIRSRLILVALSASLLATVLSGCVDIAGGGEDIAKESARESVAVAAEQVREDIAEMAGNDLVEFEAAGGLHIDRSFVGLSAEQIAASEWQGPQTITLSVDSDSLTFLSMGEGESGGGWSYNQGAAHLCWSLSVDIAAKTIGRPENADCPDGVAEFANSTLITL